MKLTCIAVLTAGASCLALPACSSSNEAPPGPADGGAPFDGSTVDGTAIGETRDGAADASNPDATQEAGTSAAYCVSERVGPAGGTLAHPGGATMVVPAGALSAATWLSLCPEGTSVAGSVGPAFQAEPEGQVFLQPVSMTVAFDATKLPVGVTANAVQMRMAPAGATSFVALQSSVDLAHGLLHTTTTHFTQFVPALSTNPIFATSPPTLPQATTGTPYSQSFAASGGTPPYAWSVSPSSVLPPGLALSGSGLLSGTPTAQGAYAFFVTVTDSASDAVEAAMALTVVPSANPAPTLASVAPSTAPQGSGDTVVVLSGTGFVPTSVAQWDGTALPTTYVNATQLAATVPASDLAAAGTHATIVTSPAPGGGTSGSVAFTVTPATVNPVPAISAVSPSAVPISSIDVQVDVTGSNFIDGTSAAIGTQGIATSVRSPTDLLAVIPASYLSTAGTLAIGVSNPAPGGGFAPTTASVTVGDLNPVPSLSALAPSSVTAGSAAFTLVLSGSQFVTGAQAFLGDTALATTYVSDTSVQAAVPAYLVANAGSAAVVLVNPAPGGGASNAIQLPFTAGDGGTGASSDAGANDGGAASAAPGTLGGPCFPSLTMPCGDTTMMCDTGSICHTRAGAQCSDSSQCYTGTTCLQSDCTISVCGTTATGSTTTCALPGLQSGSTGLTTCAAGYTCANQLNGYWAHTVPGCGGTSDVCIPTVGAGQACSLSPYTSSSQTACAAGLFCSPSADGGNVCQ